MSNTIDFPIHRQLTGKIIDNVFHVYWGTGCIAKRALNKHPGVTEYATTDNEELNKIFKREADKYLDIKLNR